MHVIRSETYAFPPDLMAMRKINTVNTSEIKLSTRVTVVMVSADTFFAVYSQAMTMFRMSLNTRYIA